jgi:CheY-like chemotaxis protein
MKDEEQREDPLKDKLILIVDDEPDVLETVAGIFEMSMIHKAPDYETAVQYLMTYTYDVVILDIMGVRGFALLRLAVMKGFPTVMFTAHALSPKSLKRAIKLGAVSFLPKEKLGDLKKFIEDIVVHGGKPAWSGLFEKLGAYFNRRFGADWKDKDKFFREFEEALRNGNKKE